MGIANKRPNEAAGRGGGDKLGIGIPPKSGCVKCECGWLPIVWVKHRKDGRGSPQVNTTPVACTCALGNWFAKRGAAIEQPVTSYTDLPNVLKEQYDGLETLTEFSAFNRLREVELRKKLDLPYFDYEAKTWHGFDGDDTSQALKVKSFQSAKDVLKDVAAKLGDARRTSFLEGGTLADKAAGPNEQGNEDSVDYTQTVDDKTPQGRQVPTITPQAITPPDGPPPKKKERSDDEFF